MFNKSGLILFGILMLLLGCITESQEKTEYTDYSNEYFSLKYPKSWNIEESKEDNDISIEFISRQENSKDKVLDEMIVEIFQKTQDLDSTGDFEKFEKKLLYEDEKITSTERSKFNGYDTITMTYEGYNKELGTTIKSFAMYFSKDNKVFRIHYAYETSEEKKYQPIFQEMIKNFKVNYVYKEPQKEKVEYSQYAGEYFIVEYPKEWIIYTNEEITKQDFILDSKEFSSRLENSNDEVEESLLFIVYKPTENFTTFTDFENYEKNLLYENEKIEKSEIVKLNQENTLRLDILDSSLQTKTVVFYQLKNEKPIRISYFYELEKEEKYKPVFEEMINSVKTNPSSDKFSRINK